MPRRRPVPSPQSSRSHAAESRGGGSSDKVALRRIMLHWQASGESRPIRVNITPYRRQGRPAFVLLEVTGEQIGKWGKRGLEEPG